MIQMKMSGDNLNNESYTGACGIFLRVSKSASLSTFPSFQPGNFTYKDESENRDKEILEHNLRVLKKYTH